MKTRIFSVYADKYTNVDKISLRGTNPRDRAQLVGLGIPLRCIAKPSYSPLGTNPNVGSNAAGQFSHLKKRTEMSKL